MPRFDVVREKPGVLRDPGKTPGTPGVEPGETKKVYAWHVCDAALVGWISLAIEDRDFHPAVIGSVAHTPDDGSNVCLAVIQFGAACSGLPNRPVTSLDRCVNLVGLDEIIDGRLNAFGNGVGLIKVVLQIVSKKQDGPG